MTTQKGGGLVARAVHEALATVVSSQLSDQLVTRALKASSLSQIPESGPAIASWIDGPLHSEIEATVGGDAAEFVSAQLAVITAHATYLRAPQVSEPEPLASQRPTDLLPGRRETSAFGDEPNDTAPVHLSSEKLAQLRLLASDDEPTTPPQGASQPRPSKPIEPPRVLAACSEVAAVDALRDYLAGSAEVVHVSDLIALVDAINDLGTGKPVVLLDCRRPTVRLESLAAIGQDLPEDMAVVLWGANEERWRELDHYGPLSCRWVRCSHEATTDDVGALCMMLIG